MKKIGIATYIKNYNYGSVLQSFALKNVVREMGYSAHIIDFSDMSLSHNRRMKLRNYFDSMRCIICHPYLLWKELSRKKSTFTETLEVPEKKKEIFREFEEEYLLLNKENYLKRNAFDAFICGSDQVWKLSIPGLHSFFFLRFTETNKRIAYAPSFGGNKVPKYNKKRLIKYLNSFLYISLREQSGVEIVEELTGKKVPCVLDPTLLAGKDFWLRVVSDIIINNKSRQYILCYFLDDNPNGIILANKIAKEKNLKIFWITNARNISYTGETIVPSPLEFVSMVCNANYVITDSFHGVIFSIMLNTDFYVLPRFYKITGEQHTRIQSILDLTGLNSRYLDGTLDDFSIEDIDFDYANRILRIAQNESRQYLSHALDSI